MYIVTLTLSTSSSHDECDVSNVFSTSEAANEAAKRFGKDYAFDYASDANDEYKEELTSDGRLTVHLQDRNEQTFEARVEARTLEVPATAAAETRERRHKRLLLELERRKKNQRVYIVTNQAYDPMIQDLGSEEIIGVYGSVSKANVAARETMKDNLGGSEDEDEDEGSEDESDVDPREEGFDSEGCITLTAAEGRCDQWMCSVNSYKVG